MANLLGEIKMQLDAEMSEQEIDFNLWGEETRGQILLESAREILAEYSDGISIEELVQFWIEKKSKEELFFTDAPNQF